MYCICDDVIQMDEYYRNNTEFLDRMRHITCFDHVQRVKGFVADFLSTPQTPEDASSTVRDFVEVGVAILATCRSRECHVTSGNGGDVE